MRRATERRPYTVTRYRNVPMKTVTVTDLSYVVGPSPGSPS